MIHRYWCGPNEPNVLGKVWHDEDFPPEILAWCDSLMGLVTGDDIYRHRSNMLRWWLLAEHGGTWLDHDVTLHGSLPSGDWVASANGYACAAAIQLSPHHPLSWNMLEAIASQSPGERSAPQASGAIPLTRLSKQLGVRWEDIPSHWISHGWVTSRGRGMK